jgi:FKBP-type peptidyl-prolyl cis-trans isomerase FkpA
MRSTINENIAEFQEENKNHKMKKILFLATVSFLVMNISCQEPPEFLTAEEQLEKDIRLIEEYLDENNITAQVDPTLNAIYYVIHEEGQGEIAPLRTDQVVVSYKGRVLGSEELFDENDSITFTLGNLIAGWQVGMRQMVEGDSATLYIPSGYGYGRFGAGRIGPNENLQFDIRLIDIVDK